MSEQEDGTLLDDVKMAARLTKGAVGLLADGIFPSRTAGQNEKAQDAIRLAREEAARITEESKATELALREHSVKVRQEITELSKKLKDSEDTEESLAAIQRMREIALNPYTAK